MTKAAALTLLRRLSWVEEYMPARKTVQFRYVLQKHLGLLEPEFELLPLLAAKDKIAIDAGANAGVFSYRLGGLSSAVYAFEPLKWLAERIDAARLENVRVENIALSDRNGVSRIKIPVMSGVVRHTRASLGVGNEGVMEQEVILRPLDEYNLSDVGFMKVDVEGHEYELLMGAVNTIYRSQPNIFIEIEDWRLVGRSIDEFFELFAKWGYQGYFYWCGKKMAVENFDVSVHQGNRNDLHKEMGYVNNFLFLPSGTSVNLPSDIGS